MLEKDKAEKGQDVYSPDLYEGNYAKCKNPSNSAADMYCYCSQRLYKSSFPYVKILVPAIFFLKTRRSSKNLLEATWNKHFLSRLVPSRTQFCDWPLELRTRLFNLNTIDTYFTNKIDKSYFLQWAGLRHSLLSHLKEISPDTSTISPSPVIGN